MTVDRIIPCVCCEHPPSVDDGSSYGMPILKPSNGFLEHLQFCDAPLSDCGQPHRSPPRIPPEIFLDPHKNQYFHNPLELLHNKENLLMKKQNSSK